MENISPQSLSTKNDVSFVTPLGGSTQSSTTAYTMADVERLVVELSNPDMRENALLVLSKMIKSFQELAPLLWNSFGTIAVFLQEIISIYPTLSSLNLTVAQSTRVCNVLAILQFMASHPDTRMAFLNANMPFYLYPFLQTTSKLTQFEYLRIASLGVIAASVKINTKENISFFLSSEIIPLCLCNMEIGKELTKTVATFIIQKILLNDDGLAYVCATVERFFAVCHALEMTFGSLENQLSPRLLKLIITCYSRLSQNCRAAMALTSCLPKKLTDANLINCLSEDPTTQIWLKKLHENVGVNQLPLV